MLVEKLEKISLNRKLFKKLLCTVLALATAFTSLPLMLTGASAYDDEDYAVSEDGFYYTQSTYYFEDSSKYVDDIRIYGYNDKNAKKIVIPEEIDGYPVMEIANNAFQDFDSLTEIVIPDSVISIRGGAFESCDSLKSITIPKSVETIGYNCFSNCISLSSVVLNEGLKTIESFAFENCSSLTGIKLPSTLEELHGDVFSGTQIKKVNIPKNVNYISCYAFTGCDQLSEITVSSENKKFTAQNGVLFDKKMTQLILYPMKKSSSSYTIPNTVNEIAYGAFMKAKSLEKVTIPDSVKTINTSAFNGASSLKDIDMSANAKEVCRDVLKGTAFYNNTSNWDNDGKILYCENVLFEAKKTVSGPYTVKKGTTSIADYAFERCKDLTEINFPTSLKYIGQSAFYGCKKIKELTLDYNITYVHSFYGCDGLEKLTVDSPVIDFEYFPNLKEVTLGNNVKKIERLYNCPKLTTVHIGSSVEEIRVDAFYYDNSLKNITVDGKNKNVYIENGTLFNECDATYYDYDKEKDVTSHEIRLIKVFDNSKAGADYVIPDNVTEICYEAFYTADSVKNLTVPKSVKTIYRYGLDKNDVSFDIVNYDMTLDDVCSFVKSNPNYLPVADTYQLKGSTTPKKVSLDKSWNNTGAFRQLAKFDFIDNIEVSKDSKRFFSYDGAVYEKGSSVWIIAVPTGKKGTLNLYDLTDDIYNSTFANCKYITNVNISSKNNCMSFKDGAILSKNGDTIYVCLPSNSGNYIVPESVKYVDYDSFSGCKKIDTVIFKENVVSLKSDVFRDCKNLSAVVIPKSVESIGNETFRNCPNLTDVYYNGSEKQWKKIVYNENEVFYNCPKAVIHYNSGKIDNLLSPPSVTATNVASSGYVKLTWNAVDGATSYKVYRAESKTGTYKLMKTTTATSYVNSSATAGKTYYYKVLAADKNGTKGVYSQIVSRTCDLPQPVVTASNVASSGYVKLTWNKIDGAVSYKVYRSETKDGTYKLMKTTTSTSYTNSSAVAGKKYYYKVKAVASNSAANSAYSTVKSRTCDLARPAVSLSVNNNGKPTLTWKAIDGAVSYKVYRATSKDGTYKLMKTATGTSYTNTSISHNTTYYYKVKAISSNTDANSAYSTIVDIRTK